MKELITSKIEEVRYNGGHSTRKPSTVTMAVPHKFAVQVADLMEEYAKQNIEPEEGLLRLELTAHYSEPEFEDDGGDEKADGDGKISEELKMIAEVITSSIKEERPDDSEPGEQIITDMTEDLDTAIEGDDTDG